MRRYWDARERTLSHRLLDHRAVDVAWLYPECINHKTSCIFLLAEYAWSYSLVFIPTTCKGALQGGVSLVIAQGIVLCTQESVLAGDGNEGSYVQRFLHSAVVLHELFNLLALER